MNYLIRILLLLWLIPLALPGCRDRGSVDGMHFTRISSSKSGVSFNNQITESDSLNVFINEYMYNGSGVGIGDFNKDGLQDIFLGGSMVSSKLYLNRGNFRFEDITEKAGLTTSRWISGISIVDINADGFPDIYLSVSHAKDPEKRKNQLFINDGSLHFMDEAEAYGLADTGYATQAAFFDYDRDGDLDVYLLNHRLYSHKANNLQPKDSSGNSPAQDRLYRNEGVAAGKSHPFFKDVTLEAGIREDGYGLGVVITDVNMDNLPDIYVANDYIANDLLWLNRGNGTFINIIASAMRHQSYNSMGVDAADINNDLLPDIATLDMLPQNNERKKMMLNATSQEKFDMQGRFGYEPSFMRNMLQLNNGNRKVQNREEPFYSEIGQLAGVFETDWSWSVLMADFDNDSWKDIFVTNGLGKDVTNNDYAAFRNDQAHINNYTFGATKAREPLDAASIRSLRKEIDAYGSVRMRNYLFKNNGDLTFRDVSGHTGLNLPSISNGAAYADLDNDGDLDLVVNNTNEEAFLLRNEIRKSDKDSSFNFLQIQLRGPAGNRDGLGAKVIAFFQNGMQLLEQSPVRGFASSVDYRLHLGTGEWKQVDSIRVVWPDGLVQMFRQVKTNQVLIVDHRNAAASGLPVETGEKRSWLSDITQTAGFEFQHREVQHFDFNSPQPLIQRYSQLGPCLSTGDVNGDGLIDFFAGGAANQSGKIFIQNKNGGFVSRDLVTGMKPEEDLGSVLFDADGDKDLDLLITGGSYEFSNPRYNQPRLYSNDGKGNFVLHAEALPVITDITRAVTVADIDEDGDLDIFIGGRLVPQKYSQTPRSFVLQNNGGIFTDVTALVCKSLEYAGMIEDALFTDFNNDQLPDLVIAGEWSPVRFFKNVNHKLTEVILPDDAGNKSGWWRSLQQADLDGDGDIDFVAGNLGWNNRYHTGPGRPVMLFAKDLDKNGFDELIPAYYIMNKKDEYDLYPSLDRNQLAEQVPAVKKKYLLHRDYSRVTMNQLMQDFDPAGWKKFTCEEFSSCWIENLGNGSFTFHALPLNAQLAPVNCILPVDIDQDGHIDLIMAGNEYQTAVSTGRYDASYGLVLKGDGRGGFIPMSYSGSGLILDGDIKALQLISVRGKENLLLAAVNDSRLKIFRMNTESKP